MPEEGYPEFFTEEQVKTLEAKVADTVPDNIVHNWLYSVVPVSGTPINVLEENGTTRKKIPTEAALVGYCRNCGRAFSKIVPTSYTYKEYPMDVERYGCIVPERP